ncbi:MAG: DUF695 domain-containing protein [Muribaculaceae bacterium]|jgi:Family of unknown function (DUF695).|nr:DUF695 domain-containing protein [Muribaculaceae bacterium]
MAKLVLSDEWWTAPAEGATGNLIMVTGRRGLWPVQQLGHYTYRVEVTWRYHALPDGMPTVDDAKLMGEVHDALLATFDADPVAVLAGVSTGDGERSWLFYARSLHIFQRKFNEALAQLPTLPLEFHAEEDPDWDEYRELCETEL